MIKNLVTSAVFAGFGAGLIAALLQIMLLVPIILEAEEYESGAKVHFEMVMETESEHAHDDSHEHDAEDSLWSRNFQTTLWTLGTYVGFALILVAAFGMAGQYGIEVNARSGILWGAAGFVAIHLAPAIGLAPELPGNFAPVLQDRQIWWALTVVATAAGIGAIGFGKSWVIWAVGIALLAAPHIIGAPHITEFGGVSPPELAGEFASRSLAVGAIGWVCLGLFAGYFWEKSNA